MRIVHTQNKSGTAPTTKPRRFAVALLLYCMVCYGIAPLALAQSGTIAPNAIQIDINANLYDTDANAAILNSGATKDWVKDSLANTDTPGIVDSVATGLITGVSAAAGGTGHWNGVRVVDGIAGNDQDIFLTGGKENDVSSWNVGPGSVGSSKYDVTQAYIANNQTDIFFGMERRGNNGTTAFDFEFNQLGTAGGYVPNRSVNDILITFEMQGSGGSGSATPFFFRWDGTTYAPIAAPAGVVTSINNSAVAPEPWGYVNSNGNWVLSPDIPRFEFAEAKVPLSVLPTVNACGGAAFVQVRTRASSTPNSDLKDTTKIFRYVFGGPAAAGQLTAGCGTSIHYDGSGSADSGSGGTLTYSWQFQKLVSGTYTDVGSPVTGVSGDYDPGSAGTYRAILTITENGSCTDSVTTNSVTVYPAVGGSASLTPDCDDTFAYSATGTGGSGSYTFEWSIYKEAGTTDGLAATFTTGPGTSSSGTLDVDDFATGAKGDGSYYASVKIIDAAATSCFFTAAALTYDIRHALTATVAKTSATTNANQLDGSYSVLSTGSTNYDADAGSLAVTRQWQHFTGGVWTDVAGATSTTLSRTFTQIIASGTTDVSESLVTVLSDPYSFRRSSLQLRIIASQTRNGGACPATSSPITVRALKAIDP